MLKTKPQFSWGGWAGTFGLEDMLGKGIKFEKNVFKGSLGESCFVMMRGRSQ